MIVAELAAGRGVCSDLGELHEALRERVTTLLTLVPHAAVWETYRSPERAEGLALLGMGKARSVHCLRLAVDVVHDELLWNAPGWWWQDLAAAGEHVRLYRTRRRGRDGKAHWDLPHLQATPPTHDARVWRMAPDVRDLYVRAALAARPVRSAPFVLPGAALYQHSRHPAPLG